MTGCVATAVVAVLLLAAAPAPKEDDARTLQGAWQAVTYEAGGMAVKDVAEKVVCTCEKDILTFQYEGKVIWRATFKLDPSKKPRTIDITITEGRRDDDKGKELHGIYELGKDGLRWCTSEPGGTDRPTAFATKEGTRESLVTLKKEKP